MELSTKAYFNRLKSLIANKRFSQLAIEITCILILKVVLIWLLWACCFSHPIHKSERQQAVTKLILNKS